MNDLASGLRVWKLSDKRDNLIACGYETTIIYSNQLIREIGGKVHKPRTQKGLCYPLNLCTFLRLMKFESETPRIFTNQVCFRTANLSEILAFRQQNYYFYCRNIIRYFQHLSLKICFVCHAYTIEWCNQHATVYCELKLVH